MKKIHLKKIHPAFIAICLTISSTSWAQEWTRFRGPNGSGVSDTSTLPVKWTKDSFLWTIDLPGGGHSSPVVWGNKVFITCADKEAGMRTLLCISTIDGKTLWKREFPLSAY